MEETISPGGMWTHLCCVFVYIQTCTPSSIKNHQKQQKLNSVHYLADTGDTDMC